MNERVKDLEQKLEELLEENEDMRGNLQIKSEISQRIELESNFLRPELRDGFGEFSF